MKLAIILAIAIKEVVNECMPGIYGDSYIDCAQSSDYYYDSLPVSSTKVV